jgi:hypothetical protein
MKYVSVRWMSRPSDASMTPVIDLCIKNAIIDIEVQNSYAQTKRECRSSGRPAQTSFGVAG